MPITVSQRAREYIRRRAQDHMTGTVTLYRPTEASFDDETGIVEVPTRNSYYSGKCRVAPMKAGSTVVVGEADITTVDTTISIPFGSPSPKADDVAIVTVNPSDPTVEGRAFQVIGYSGGGLIGGVIQMTCKSLDDSAVWHRV